MGLNRRHLLSGLAIAGLLIPASVHAAGVDQFMRHTTGSTMTVDHAIWDRQLTAYVAPDKSGLNRVDYRRWKADGHKDLKTYVAALQAVDPARLDRAEQMAFWINLYNARTIDIVLDKYPVKSIKDISLGGGLKSLVTGGPWQANVVKVAGVDMSLDDIEHKVLRPVYKDARIHYGVNCASYGCPNLAAAAYTGANLEAMLEAGAKAFINHPRGIAVKDGKVTASSIYTWFEVDFGKGATDVLAHVRKYANADLAKQLDGITTIAAYDYVWTLNDIVR